MRKSWELEIKGFMGDWFEGLRQVLKEKGVEEVNSSVYNGIVVRTTREDVAKEIIDQVLGVAEEVAGMALDPRVSEAYFEVKKSSPRYDLDITEIYVEITDTTFNVTDYISLTITVEKHYDDEEEEEEDIEIFYKDEDEDEEEI
ncbi:MAG: hypothetical protein QW512_00490 [Thermofilaceae archaeon]